MGRRIGATGAVAVVIGTMANEVFNVLAAVSSEKKD